MQCSLAEGPCLVKVWRKADVAPWPSSGRFVRWGDCLQVSSIYWAPRLGGSLGYLGSELGLPIWQTVGAAVLFPGSPASPGVLLRESASPNVG